MSAAMGLSPSDLNKLVGVLGMLGSPHPGERDNAARLADRLVRGRGMEWADLLVPKPATYMPPPPPPNDVDADLRVCRAYPGLLTEWERGFLRGLKPGRSLSAKQQRILSGMARKVRAG
ncbi:MAG: hypothetical protein ACRYHQ_22840 [Janthinobacterium lividum]